MFDASHTSLGACATALAALRLLLLLLSSRACLSASASLLLLVPASGSPVDMLLDLRLFLRASGEIEARSVMQLASRSISYTIRACPVI